MRCSNCNTEYNDINEFNKHLLVCIYYIYNSKYSKKISNDTIKNILEYINMLELHEININHLFTKSNILEIIQIEYKINNSFRILNDSNNIQITNKNILYFYNYFNNNIQEIYSYIDVITIIANVYHISNNDILNIINCYKISCNNCEF